MTSRSQPREIRADGVVHRDAPGRRGLFELYLCEAIDDDTMAVAVAGTDGAAAAFIKELARRATLRSIRTETTLAEAIRHSITDMRITATPLLRSALAANKPAPGSWDAR